MKNFELIEKYISGELKGAERETFENQLQADNSLRGDVALQRQIIEGIKKARMTELKAMLNQVPVTGAMQAGASSVQIVSGVVTLAALVTGTLFYVKPWAKEKQVVGSEKVVPPVEKNAMPDITATDTREDKTSTTPVIGKGKESKKKKAPLNAKTAHPKIEVVDPTDELTKEPTTQKGKTDNPQSTVIASRIAVETNAASEKYSFHYHFSQGKLILYGNFDKGLYEILEVNGDNHSVFLYYKDIFYLLNEQQSAITPLTAIKDQELIRKLRAYRGQ